LVGCCFCSVDSVWKDVPGVMNADPRYFENASLLNQISYREAIELAFYGATVIHQNILKGNSFM
jgi:aspartate kinase